MASLPPVKRLVREEFPDQKGWIGKLLDPINRTIEFLSGAFNKGIDFDNNIACIKKEIEFLNDVNAFPITFQNTLRTKPWGVFIGYAEDVTTGAVISLGNSPSWELNAKAEIQINGISGLTSDREYVVRLLVI